MGLLDKLWDETLAGPTPDSGLGKLRKYNSFSASLAAAPPPQISPSIPIPGAGGGNNNYRIRNLTVSVDSASSPSSSSAPNSPFSRNTPLILLHGMEIGILQVFFFLILGLLWVGWF